MVDALPFFFPTYGSSPRTLEVLFNNALESRSPQGVLGLYKTRR